MKTAYLTIDDAPSAFFKQKVDYLFERQIPALFFCNGQNIHNREAELCYAINKGFLIGNHSYSHPHFSDLTLEQCIEEIKKTDRLIHEIYRRVGVPWPMKCFRFPYFDGGGDENGDSYEARRFIQNDRSFKYPYEAKRLAIQTTLRDLGYRHPDFKGVNLKYFNPKLLSGADVRCTFDQTEYWLGKTEAPWGLSSVDAIMARIDEDEPYAGRSLNRLDTADIILVHDHENTNELFFKIIDRYLEKGILFLPIA